MPTNQIGNPASALSDGTATWSGTYEYYISAETSTTIADGEVVSLNTSGKILKATTSVSQVLCIGVADEPIPAGALGRVQVGGIKASVPAEGAITAPALVGRSGTTAGAVASLDPGDTADPGLAVGFAIADAASSLVTIYVGKL